MAPAGLNKADLARLAAFLLDMQAAERNFLLDLFEREAVEFLRKIESSLPDLNNIVNWDPRLLQQLIRNVDFKTIAWVLYDRETDLIQVFAENMSARGRKILLEEIQAVKNEKRRRLEEGSWTPEKLERFTRKKKLILLLHAHCLSVSWEKEYGTKK